MDEGMNANILNPLWNQQVPGAKGVFVPHPTYILEMELANWGRK